MGAKLHLYYVHFNILLVKVVKAGNNSYAGACIPYGGSFYFYVAYCL